MVMNSYFGFMLNILGLYNLQVLVKIVFGCAFVFSASVLRGKEIPGFYTLVLLSLAITITFFSLPILLVFIHDTQFVHSIIELIYATSISGLGLIHFSSGSNPMGGFGSTYPANRPQTSSFANSRFVQMQDCGMKHGHNWSSQPIDEGLSGTRCDYNSSGKLDGLSEGHEVQPSQGTVYVCNSCHSVSCSTCYPQVKENYDSFKQ